ncbi:unnamed protein product [Schistocephalus solidus]|uniref:G-protein coupled receptor 183 n=1 Tax=Schistocephalus solidus TaxID=70667 RepID=A0A0X3Q979_SCHSO|nr:unnamed protein product [Schistocephalus solidus]
MSWEGSSLIDPENVDCNGSLVLSFSQRLVYIFRAYLSPLIFIEGVIGNTLTVVLFIKLHKQTPGRFNIYAAAISVSFLLIIIFDTLLDDFFGRGLGWLTGFRINLKLDQMSSMSCKLITYIIDCSAFIATTILSVFSVDRVCTIYYPLKLRGNHYVRMTCGIIAFIVCLGLVLFCPTFIFYDIVRGETNKTACTLINPSLPGAKYMLLTYVIGSYTLPTLVIFISNLVICCELLRLKSQQQFMGRSVHSDPFRVINHLGINSAFLLLMIPLVVVILLRYDAALHTSEVSLEYTQRLTHLSRFFSSLLSVYYANSFWIFFIFLPNFRDAVFSLLLSCPLIARSCCGSCLLKRMSQTGIRRLRSRSLLTDPFRAIQATLYGASGGVNAGVALHAAVMAPKRFTSLPLISIEKV